MPNLAGPAPRPLILDPARHAHLVPGIAAVHMSCITHDAMIATFLPPLDASRVEDWWRARLGEAARGLRVIVLLVVGGDEAGAGANGDTAEGAEVVAVVMFTTGTSETVPHVAGVEKYMVSPAWRRRGLGRDVMLLLEREAKARGRTLLVSSCSSVPGRASLCVAGTESKEWGVIRCRIGSGGAD